MISAMTFSREEVYIADMHLMVPLDPTQAIDNELGTCIAYLHKQIEIVKPKVIVFLGPLPLRLLLNKRGISKYNGQWSEYMGAKVMPTFHPAYLLREPSAKKDAWDSLQKVMAELNHKTT